MLPEADVAAMNTILYLELLLPMLGFPFFEKSNSSVRGEEIKR